MYDNTIDLPFSYLLVTAQDTVLNVYGMVAHTPQHYCLVQSSHDKHSIMQLCNNKSLCLSIESTIKYLYSTQQNISITDFLLQLNNFSQMLI